MTDPLLPDAAPPDPSKRRRRARDFGLCRLFKEAFPLECIALYFRNINMSFGNKVYDESFATRRDIIFSEKDFDGLRAVVATQEPGKPAEWPY